MQSHWSATNHRNPWGGGRLAFQKANFLFLSSSPVPGFQQPGSESGLRDQQAESKSVLHVTWHLMGCGLKQGPDQMDQLPVEV